MKTTDLGKTGQRMPQAQSAHRPASPPETERRRRQRVLPRTLKSHLVEQINREFYRRLRTVFGIVPSFLERPEDVRALFAYQPPD
jgi:hypothetical protein